MTEPWSALLKTLINGTTNFFFCFLVVYLITRLPLLKNPRLRYALFLIPFAKLWCDFFAGIASPECTWLPGIDRHALDLCVSVGFGSAGMSLWSIIFSCIIGQHVCSLGDLVLYFTGGSLTLMATLSWLATALFLIIRRNSSYLAFLRKIRERATDDSRLQRILTEAQGGRETLVEGVLSPYIASPVAAGILKPFIAIPADLMKSLTDEELHLILRHEMGHINRQDNMLNQALALTSDIFFFLPPLRWLVKEITYERERLCDRYAVNNREAHALSFARALTKVAEYGIMQKTPEPAMALSGLSTASSEKKALFSRVQDILSDNKRERDILDQWYIHGPLALLLLKLLIGVSFFASSGHMESTTCAAMRIIVSA
jgi:beta-lactamase regulating signal transducer with metallopeptidase domain